LVDRKNIWSETIRVLDVGSGLNKYQGKAGDTVIGMDLFNAGSADVIHDINIFPYPFPDNYFDMVWVHHSFEHMDDAYDIKEHKSNQIKAVEEFWRITKPGGKVMIFVPHWSSFVTWGHIDHRRGYGFGTFNMFDISNKGEQVNSKVRFKVKSRIRWILYFTHTNNKIIGKMFEVISAPVEWMINRNYLTKLVSERFFANILGFDEVQFELEKVV
jgi:SAM-dependent methyltransferase